MSYTQQLTKKQIRDKLYYLKKTNQIEKYKKALKKYRDITDDEEEQPKPTRIIQPKPTRIIQQYPEENETETEENETETEENENLTEEDINVLSSRIDGLFNRYEKQTIYKWFSLMPDSYTNYIYYKYFKETPEHNNLKKQIQTIDPYYSYLGY